MASDIPPIRVVHPNGSCYCGCGEVPKRGKFFVVVHDRRAEARVVRERVRPHRNLYRVGRDAFAKDRS